MTHSQSDRLRAVIAVSRLSDRHSDKAKLDRLDDRNKDLAEFAVAAHRDTHLCSCVPEIHTILLNGVSSNTNAEQCTASSIQLTAFRKILEDLTQRSQDGTTLIVVSTIDGLWTNVYGFVNFFAPYLEKLRLEYLIHEGFGSYRQYSVIQLVQAICEVLEGKDLSHLGTNTDQLIRQWIVTAYNKLYQREGNLSVRVLMTQMRNTSIIDITSSQLRPHMDPSTRVVRIIRSGGTDFQPIFKQEEEQRHRLEKTGGFLLCPERNCGATYLRLDQLVHHLLENILTVSPGDRSCPLCPAGIARWNYLYLADGIYHLLRHLSPPNSKLLQDKRKAQCPFCFILMPSASIVYKHIEYVHLRALEIRWAAVSSNLVSRETAAANDEALTLAIRDRNRTELAQLPDLYRQLATMSKSQVSWSGSLFRAYESAPSGNPFSHISLLSLKKLMSPLAQNDLVPHKIDTSHPSQPVPATSLEMTTAHSVGHGVSGSSAAGQKWFMKFSDQANVSGNQRRNTRQVAIQRDDKNWLLCPLEAECGLCRCKKSFESTKSLCEHIWLVLSNCKDRSQRRCPWCPSKPDIILKHTEKNARRTSRPNDIRHLRRHFPPDVVCALCDHLSRTESDMWTHLRTVHYTWHCKQKGCKAIFETEEELKAHAEFGHSESSSLAQTTQEQA
ncbi:hypothetical protein PV08_04540 [Exophiala spinifera]|uniref:C2H2-type domain-containing protein n=1 Tax=Exophiala spinifera TaxID=91928 RepID=A0A0D2BEC6_9EURO|nr:uncharacterized protein PV08_04540 [Exophiala spinifera]KIW17348.1 hypothetical protein PV08_04540 [Exophiala spinifera]